MDSLAALTLLYPSDYQSLKLSLSTFTSSKEVLLGFVSMKNHLLKIPTQQLE